MASGAGELMALRTTHEVRDELLWFRSVGVTYESLDDALRHIRELLETAKEYGSPSFLVDRREVVRGERPVADTMAFADEAPGVVVDFGHYVRTGDGDAKRIALLVRPDVFPMALASESAFHSRGVNVRFFDDEATAVAWVTGSHDERSG